MAVTIKDVAERAQVSIKTVSRVLNREDHVRPELRARIEKVIAELDYRPNSFARSLSSSRSYLIGMLIDDISWSSYTAAMQRGAFLRCRERGFHLIVETVDLQDMGWKGRLSDTIRGLRLDGAILLPALCGQLEVLEVLEGLKLPYVRVSPGERLARSAVVEIDERQAAFEIVNHLVEIGHRDIGFISGLKTHASSKLREAGYRAAMLRAGANPDQFRETGDFTLSGGMAAAARMLSGRERPTAIFACNDEMALGVSTTATRIGLTVPIDLAIVGFDDAPFARVAWPPITTVRQPMMDMASAAVDILIDPRYHGDGLDPAHHRTLPYELIVRESSGVAAPLLQAC